MSEANVEAVRRCLDGWNRRDVEAWLEPLHPHGEWRSEVAQRLEGSEKVYRGLAEMREFWDEWHAVWELTIEVSDIRDLGDTVLALGRIETRGQASGVELEHPVAYMFHFESGLVTKARSYLDPEQALEDAGLVE